MLTHRVLGEVDVLEAVRGEVEGGHGARREGQLHDDPPELVGRRLAAVLLQHFDCNFHGILNYPVQPVATRRPYL